MGSPPRPAVTATFPDQKVGGPPPGPPTHTEPARTSAPSRSHHDRNAYPFEGSRDRHRVLLGNGHAARGSLRKGDRKSTRLNSSHLGISYAVFCLKKKKNTNIHTQH